MEIQKEGKAYTANIYRRSNYKKLKYTALQILTAMMIRTLKVYMYICYDKR